MTLSLQRPAVCGVVSQWVEDVNGNKLSKPVRVWVTEITTVSTQLSKLTVSINSLSYEAHFLVLELMNSSSGLTYTVRTGS